MNLLDEDELPALHKRVLRARDYHAKNYRRRASVGVAEEGARANAQR